MQRRLLVDLEALAANYALFQRASALPTATVGAVVKANGYGIGVLAAARRLARAGCNSFFVASVEEALNLRDGLREEPGGSVEVESRIYCFEGPEVFEASGCTAELAASRIVPVLNHERQLECWRSQADLPVAVQIDTGLTRLGFARDVLPGTFEGFRVELLLTQLACADQVDHPLNEIQVTRFKDVSRRFPGVPTSLGNSAGWLAGAQLQGELGRPGIGLYGGNPFSDRANPCAPVASLQGRVLQLKEISAGDSVGYGATYVASRPRRVAVVAIGYADGVPLKLSDRGEMVCGDQRCAILGRVSMDVSVIDVTDVREVAVGDWVECFGTRIGLDEVAGWAGTIAYEVLTGVGARVERCYQPLPEE